MIFIIVLHLVITGGGGGGGEVINDDDRNLSHVTHNIRNICKVDLPLSPPPSPNMLITFLTPPPLGAPLTFAEERVVLTGLLPAVVYHNVGQVEPPVHHLSVQLLTQLLLPGGRTELLQHELSHSILACGPQPPHSLELTLKPYWDFMPQDPFIQAEKPRTLFCSSWDWWSYYHIVL